nr:hypothetical protein [Tanacetum cinerariifolium]
MTMDTTIEQQAAMDEALVPHVQRVHGQSFDEPPFEEEILAFIHFLGHSATIKRLTDVNINKLYQPWRSFAAIINKCLTGKSSGYNSLRLSQAQILNSNAYKEYYAIAIRATPPKPKASVRRRRSSSDTSITPPIAIASPRLTAFTKGKQKAKAFEAKSLSALSEVAMTKAQQLKLVTKRSMQQRHISQASSSGEDEGTGSIPGDLGLNVGGEEGHVEEDEEDELYRDVNINQGMGIQANLEFEDSHVTLTSVNLDGQQQSSSVSSQFVTSMLNLTFDVVSAIPRIVQRYMDQRMNKAVKVIVQIQSDRLCDEAQRENEEFLKTFDENMQKIIKEKVKEQVKIQISKILQRIEQAVNEQLKAEVLTRLSHSSRTSYAVDADLSEMELKKILIEKMEGNKSIQRSDEQRNLYKALVKAYESDKIILDTYGETVTLKRRRDDDANKDEEPSAGPDRGSKRHRKGKEPESASALTKTATRSAGRSTQGSGSRQASANESALAEEPMQTTSQMEYLHNLLKPLPLIPNNRGLRVIPFEHFINNDLKYLHGGASSRKYTTSIMKTKAADYRHIKWIEDLVPRTMWIEEPIGFDKHALWGVSHWGRKRQQFYGFTVNRESAHNVYSKRIIIAVTELKIVEWHNYKHLDWIMNKDKRNRLMRIDELHKFSDGTLIDVRIALDDCLKGIQKQYLPQSIWRKSDKDRVATMIQAIDKRLKTRRIMRSLERFVGGRLYEGDFRMLQRTI